MDKFLFKFHKSGDIQKLQAWFLTVKELFLYIKFLSVLEHSIILVPISFTHPIANLKCTDLY